MNDYLLKLNGRYESVSEYHNIHKHLIDSVVGSGHNHQNWEGGYRDHLLQCFEIADRLYSLADYTFELRSAVIVLYFHDIEKLWRNEKIDKEKYYTEVLPNKFNIIFTNDELNALKYIHGEGDEYRKDKRIMNELASFCHSCDVLSARCFHSIKKINWK